MELYQFLFSIIALTVVKAGPATDSYKDQFCTDPRTMRKHAAYTEWADAYSCTRHRCQPGGRNLAIYTVGCKRVEAPESAIECEEVVEDTNMQFPYCCTRLRCLVVVRGEVWTRVLGQPWETLPAAPWSHMYKMKKPPPGDTAFLPKSPGEGPVYELATETERDAEKVLRSGQRSTTEAADFESEAKPMAMAMAPPAPAPDIVIALSTSNDEKSVIKERQERPDHPEHPEHQERPERPEHPERPVKKEGLRERRKRGRKGNQNAVMARDNFFEEDQQIEPRVQEPELEEPVLTEKPMEPQSDEKYYANAYGVTQRIPKTFQKSHNQQVSWTEIPQNQWNEHEHEVTQAEPENRDHDHHQPEYPPAVAEAEKKEEKPGNLQALVDAIGTRMRDIESVVQRMSEKVVQQVKPGEEGSAEKDKEKKSETRAPPETPEVHKHQPREGKAKKPNPDGEHYKRFHGRGSKYVHGTVDATSEKPLFVEDSNLNGYFSDASNTVRRASPPKEPAATYMAPVENRRKSPPHAPAEGSDEMETRRRKKHSHKKKKTKSSHHKKHHDKRKRFNRLNSVELDKNTVSLEDSNPDGNK